MPCCSYCQSANHNIIECNVDNDLVKMMECKTCPDFFHMSPRILKKIASQLNIKTSLPKIQLACSLSQYHRRQEREKEQKKENRETYEDTCCPICLEEFSEKPNNQSMTECGHKFCTSCLIQHLRKNNNCPCCRTQLIEERRPPMQHLYRYPSGPPLIPIGRNQLNQLNQPNMELLQPLELPPLPEMPQMIQIPYASTTPEIELEPGEIEENNQTLSQLPTAPESEIMERDNIIEIVGDVTNTLIELGEEHVDLDPYNLFEELSIIEDNINDFNHTLDNIMNISENNETPISITRQITPEPPTTIRMEAPPLSRETNRRNRGNITLRHYQQHFS